MTEKGDPFGNLPKPSLFTPSARVEKPVADNLAVAKKALVAAESTPPKPKGKPHAKASARKRPAKGGKKPAKKNPLAKAVG